MPQAVAQEDAKEARRKWRRIEKIQEEITSLERQIEDVTAKQCDPEVATNRRDLAEFFGAVGVTYLRNEAAELLPGVWLVGLDDFALGAPRLALDGAVVRQARENRNVEHRLQYRDDQQTQSLPADPVERTLLAEAAGAAGCTCAMGLRVGVAVGVLVAVAVRTGVDV